jgi:tyrosyl-tRNA synthetase
LKLWSQHSISSLSVLADVTEMIESVLPTVTLEWSDVEGAHQIARIVFEAGLVPQIGDAVNAIKNRGLFINDAQIPAGLTGTAALVRADVTRRNTTKLRIGRTKYLLIRWKHVT